MQRNTFPSVVQHPKIRMRPRAHLLSEAKAKPQEDVVQLGHRRKLQELLSIQEQQIQHIGAEPKKKISVGPAFVNDVQRLIKCKLDQEATQSPTTVEIP